MQELQLPQDFAIKQMISLTCLLGQINIKNLCRCKSKLLIEVWTTAGLLRHWWRGNILLQMKPTPTAHSEGWEWWGGTTQTIFTQTSDKWDLPFIPRALYSLLPLPGLFTPRKVSCCSPWLFCYSILFQEFIKWQMCFRNRSVFPMSQCKG